MPAQNGAPNERRNRSWWYLLFLVQFGILWPPFYNKAAPALLGIPFFYWFQLLWVIVCALVTGAVYVLTRRQ